MKFEKNVRKRSFEKNPNKKCPIINHLRRYGMLELLLDPGIYFEPALNNDASI